MKKVLSLLLVACMLLTLAACSTTTPPAATTQAPAKTTQSGGNTAATSAPPATVAPVALEEIQVTHFVRSANDYVSGSAMIREFIKEEFGIDWEIMVVADNWQQRFALLVSSGDIPDLASLPVADYYEYASQGAFYDVTDSVGNYDNIMGYIPENIWPRTRVNDRIYGVPNMNVAGKYNLYLRQDWLDALCIARPTTIDQFTEVMRAYTQDDPDGNGANDTYGYGNSELRTFYGMFGAMPGYYHVDGNVSKIGSTTEEYRQCLMYIKDLYDKGYIDPEVFTQKQEQVNQKVVTGKIGGFSGWWTDGWDFYKNKSLLETQPTANFVAVDLITGPQGKKSMPGNDLLSEMVVISYKHPDPERMLAFFNWQVSDFGYYTTKYGIDGVHYKRDANGVLSELYLWTDGMKDLLGNECGINERYSRFQRMDIYKQQLGGNAEFQDIYLAGFEQAAEINPLLLNDFVGLTTVEFQTYMPDITKYVDEMRIKFLMGDESLDEANWAKYVAEYNRLGGMDVAQSLLKEYNATYGTTCTVQN